MRLYFSMKMDPYATTATFFLHSTDLIFSQCKSEPKYLTMLSSWKNQRVWFFFSKLIFNKFWVALHKWKFTHAQMGQVLNLVLEKCFQEIWLEGEKFKIKFQAFVEILTILVQDVTWEVGAYKPPSEAYSEPCQTSEMKLFVKTLNGGIFSVKSSGGFLASWKTLEFNENLKKNPGVYFECYF